MVINCENVLCIFNAEENCIKDCVNLNNEACCGNSIVITETEKNRLKDYYCNCIVNKVNEETTKLQARNEELQKEADNKDKVLADLKQKQVEHKTANDILSNARERVRTYSYGKCKNLGDSYSNTELEDLYVGQGLSIKSVSEITGIAKTTLYNRLKSAGLIDKKKAKLEGV